MTGTRWKRVRPTSIPHAMELCIQHAKARHNRSVDSIADLMGQPNKWSIYKWVESGRIPTVLIRPFEAACGISFVTQYLAASDHKLLIDMPTGKAASASDINALQSTFTAAVQQLLLFADGQHDHEATLAAIDAAMTDLASHRANVERYDQPELDFGTRQDEA
ncbi:MAG: hypothetical protein CMP08_07720 [Xanthomonadales bacterium]|nr:hypothetical protein [Xanthomonadales bacterium]|tara:strand:- start:1560 stop:2048 length:489 start_codon:yes stop_codon:yes gene_type:complete